MPSEDSPPALDPVTVGVAYTPPGQSGVAKYWWCSNSLDLYITTLVPLGALPYCGTGNEWCYEVTQATSGVMR